MPLPIIADCYRVAVRGHNSAGQICVNVLHFSKPGATSEASFRTALDANLRNIYLAGGVTGVGTSGWGTFGGGSSYVDDYTITKLDGVSASLTIPMPINGSASGDNLPPDTALVTTLRSSSRGRSKRGRTYWWGGTEANNGSDGRVLAANLLEFQANWNAVLVAPANTDAILSVASYTLGTFAIVTSCTVQPVFDRQSRRKR